jgi:hypothetical protein
MKVALSSKNILLCTLLVVAAGLFVYLVVVKPPPDLRRIIVVQDKPEAWADARRPGEPGPHAAQGTPAAAL